MSLERGWFERQARRAKVDINTMPSWLLHGLSGEGALADRAKMTRSERIQALIQFFSSSFAENAQDGTTFDCDVIETLTKLQTKYR